MNINDLIQPDRVHRSVYTDPEIFDLEMENIFHSTWQYVAHDSQVPNSGDYLSTTIGNQPMLVVRQQDSSIRILHNRCQHKGMQLVADDTSGHASMFQCGYHAWTYKTNGELRSIPAGQGYKNTKICKGAAEFALPAVADIEVYRGFIFAKVNRGGPAFIEWLGPMKSSLDNFVDRSPAGKVKVEGGVFRYEHHANWKFFLENTLDALHPMVVHRSATEPAGAIASERNRAGKAEEFAYQMILPFGAPYKFFDEVGQRGSAYGHGDLGIKASIHSGYDQVPEYWDKMVETYGEVKAKEILDTSRNNSVIYPSLMFKAPVSLLRVIKPVAVDKTILETWHFRLVEAPDELFERTIQYSSIVNSSAGMVGPDDHAAYQLLQTGLLSQASDWVQLARYPDQETEDDEGAYEAIGTSEFVQRNQFTAWQQYMERS